MPKDICISIFTYLCCSRVVSHTPRHRILKCFFSCLIYIDDRCSEVELFYHDGVGLHVPHICSNRKAGCVPCVKQIAHLVLPIPKVEGHHSQKDDPQHNEKAFSYFARSRAHAHRSIPTAAGKRRSPSRRGLIPVLGSPLPAGGEPLSITGLLTGVASISTSTSPSASAVLSASATALLLMVASAVRNGVIT